MTVLSDGNACGCGLVGWLLATRSLITFGAGVTGLRPVTSSFPRRLESILTSSTTGLASTSRLCRLYIDDSTFQTVLDFQPASGWIKISRRQYVVNRFDYTWQPRRRTSRKQPRRPGSMGPSFIETGHVVTVAYFAVARDETRVRLDVETALIAGLKADSLFKLANRLPSPTLKVGWVLSVVVSITHRWQTSMVKCRSLPCMVDAEYRHGWVFLCNNSVLVFDRRPVFAARPPLLTIVAAADWAAEGRLTAKGSHA